MKVERKTANVSFAAIAVVLFLGATVAAVQIAHIERVHDSQRLILREEREIRQAFFSARKALEARARISALTSISMSASLGVDAQALFSSDMADYVNETFPTQYGRVFVGVENLSAEIYTEMGVVEDVQPALVSERETIPGAGYTSMPSAETEDVPADTPVPLNSGMSLSFVLVGSKRLTDVNGSGGRQGKGAMVSPCEIDESLDSSRPFLIDRHGLLASSTWGEAGDMGRNIQYMLATVAQYRVLRGIASPTDHRSADHLLTEKDVEIATNLALLLEEVRAFRCVDVEAVEAFEEKNAPLFEEKRQKLLREGYITDVGERTLMSMLHRYVDHGTVDPADIFALYTCLDAEPVNIEAVISQALYTVLDQMVLKYMGYFSIPDGPWNDWNLWDFVHRFFHWTGTSEKVSVSPDAFPATDIYGYSSHPEISTRHQVFTAVNISTIKVVNQSTNTTDNTSTNASTNTSTNTSANTSTNTTGTDNAEVCYENTSSTAEWEEELSTSIGPFYIPGTPDENLVPVGEWRYFVNDSTEVYTDIGVWINHTSPINVTVYYGTPEGEQEVFSDHLGVEAPTGDNETDASQNSTFQADFVHIQPPGGERWNLTGFYLRFSVEYTETTITVTNPNGTSNGTYNVLQESNDGWFSLTGEAIITSHLNGTEITHVNPGPKPDTYREKPASDFKKTLKDSPETLGALQEAIKEVLHSLFKKITDYVSSMITGVLFGNSRPHVSPDPGDDLSLVRDTTSTITRWVDSGFYRLRQQVESEDFLSDAVAQFVAGIIGRLSGKLLDTFAAIYGKIGDIFSGIKNGFTDKLKDKIEDLLKKGVEVIASAVGKFLHWDSAEDLARRIIDSVPDYWDTFKNHIYGAVGKLYGQANTIFHNLFNRTYEVVDRMFSTIMGEFRGLVSRFIESARWTLHSLLSHMAHGMDVGAVEHRFRAMKDAPGGAEPEKVMARGVFVFKKEGGGDPTEKQELRVCQSPRYLSPEIGDFYIQISSPHGVHYTALTSISDHPYETSWNVEVRGTVNISIESGGRGVFPNGTRDFQGAVPINISVPVTVFSGWALRGVDYSASNTLWSDLKDLFKKVWKKITAVFEIMIHYVKKALSFISHLFQQLLCQASKVLDLLQSLFKKASALLYKLLNSAVYRFVKKIMDAMRGETETLSLCILGYNLTVHFYKKQETATAGGVEIALGEKEHLNISLRREKGNFDTWADMTEEDSAFHTTFSIWNIDGNLDIQSVADLSYSGEISYTKTENGAGGGAGEEPGGAQGENEGWTFTFQGPLKTKTEQVTLSFEDIAGHGITVPTPAGTATVNFGVTIDMDREAINNSIEENLGLLGTLLIDGPGSLLGGESNRTLQDLVGDIKTTIEQILSSEILENIKNTIKDISRAVSLQFFIDVVLGAGGTGAGFTLSFVINDPFYTLGDVGMWLADRITASFSSTMEKPSSASSGAMPSSASSGVRHTGHAISRETMENMSIALSLHMGSDEMGREMELSVDANLPALATLAKKDLGTWRISINMGYMSVTEREGKPDIVETDNLFVGEIVEM